MHGVLHLGTALEMPTVLVICGWGSPHSINPPAAGAHNGHKRGRTGMQSNLG